MAIPSFSAFHDEGINLEGLLEILSPENNLVLADDMMVSDGNGIILRVSETYEKNFGFAHDSIVGKSAFDLEADIEMIHRYGEALEGLQISEFRTISCRRSRIWTSKTLSTFPTS